MLRGQEERKYSIRKYSIGVVSVLAATMFVVSSHEAQASEKTPTNAAVQKETLNQPGEQGNAITSHQMQSGKQLDDMHKENGKSGTVTEGKDTLQLSKYQSTQNSKTIRTQNDNQVKQDSERQGSKQSH
ncbi:YSIRK-type signal peptide-containing protein, partial [Staphylococcus aureus]|nr:YSIRK-type signal peptide-containing protein [Staphylococcus aureus]